MWRYCEQFGKLWKGHAVHQLSLAVDGNLLTHCWRQEYFLRISGRHRTAANETPPPRSAGSIGCIAVAANVVAAPLEKHEAGDLRYLGQAKNAALTLLVGAGSLQRLQLRSKWHVSATRTRGAVTLTYLERASPSLRSARKRVMSVETRSSCTTNPPEPNSMSCKVSDSACRSLK